MIHNPEVGSSSLPRATSNKGKPSKQLGGLRLWGRVVNGVIVRAVRHGQAHHLSRSLGLANPKDRVHPGDSKYPPQKMKALLSQGLHFFGVLVGDYRMGVVEDRCNGSTAPAYFTRVLTTWLQGPRPLVLMAATRKYDTCPLGRPVNFALERVLTAASCHPFSSVGSVTVHWMW